MDEEVPKPLWFQMETLTLPSPALSSFSPKPLPGQHSLTNLLSLFKRKWETSLKQPQRSPALPSHADIHQDCSSFTCYHCVATGSSPGACPRAGGSGELLQKGNPCLPVSTRNQPSTAKERTWQVSPDIPQSFSTPQMPAHHSWSYLSSVSAGKGGIMWVKRTPCDPYTVSPEERRPDWVAGQSTHLTSLQDGVILIKQSQPASMTGALKRPKGIQDPLLQV